MIKRIVRSISDYKHKMKRKVVRNSLYDHLLAVGVQHCEIEDMSTDDAVLLRVKNIIFIPHHSDGRIVAVAYVDGLPKAIVYDGIDLYNMVRRYNA